MASGMSTEMEKNVRKGWAVGDWVEVFSKSRNEWFRAKIIEVYTDDDGEWLAVVVQDTMVKEVQRFHPDVRPLLNDDESGSDDSSEYSSNSETGSSTSEISDSSEDGSEVSASDEDNKDGDKEKNKKKSKKMRKNHELVVIFVERAGTSEINGKYVYATTNQDGYPVFEKLEDKTKRLYMDDEQERWIFSNDDECIYFVDSYADLPPAHGWQPSVKGKFPGPGVVLNTIKKISAEDPSNFFEDDPYKFSPFKITKYPFENVTGVDDLGFTMQVEALHQDFVVVKNVVDGSQAAEHGIMPGDILVNVNTEDVSKIRTLGQMLQTMNETIALIKNKTLTLTFARERNTFKVIMVARAGTGVINGKYTIEKLVDGALQFACNSNPNHKIQRIFVDTESDEGIWAIREVLPKQPKPKSLTFDASVPSKDHKSSKPRSDTVIDKSDPKMVAGRSVITKSEESSDSEEDDEEKSNNKDFYIVLTSAKEIAPPECGWEAVDPHGLWPAPGITHYDVNLERPSAPKIIRLNPNPNAVQIHFECFQAKRRPKVCPHMEVWYEIEVIHYIPGNENSSDGKSSKKQPTEDRVEKKIWKTNDSPFVANRLINGHDYQFIVHTVNHVARGSSLISHKVVPLCLPPKPKIINITGKPGELHIAFKCAGARDRDVQAKFEIIVDPPIDEKSQMYKIKEHRLLVDNDDKPVILKNLVNGQTYEIIVACVNTVGVTYSEPESAMCTLEPPQPEITRVEAGNREILVHFKCPGYDNPKIRAWFEVELSPPKPPLIIHQNANLINTQNKSNNNTNPVSPSNATSSATPNLGDDMISPDLLAGVGGMGGVSPITPPGALDLMHASGMSSPASAGFRAGFGSMSSSIAGGYGSIGGKYDHRRERSSKLRRSRWARKSKLIRRATTSRHLLGLGDQKEDNLEENYNDENFIPYFRREKRHQSSPIRITPVINGERYSVRIKSVNLSGAKITAFSDPVTPKGPPPMPRLLGVTPSVGSVEVEWECDDYATEEYKAEFEIESQPSSSTVKCKQSPWKFEGLHNGWSYKFKIRATNKEGKSKWSEYSNAVIPTKLPPEPIGVACIPFDKEIMVYWVSEDVKALEYGGWFEVESEPPTYQFVAQRSQARFRRLTNGVSYRFRVWAINHVGRTASALSDVCTPDSNISKKTYEHNKKQAACQVREMVRSQRQQKQKEKTSEQLYQVLKRKEKAELKAKQEKDSAAQKKKQRQEERRRKAEHQKQKKETERLKRKEKQQAHRDKVLNNKRRQSILNRQKIDVIQSKWKGKPAAGGGISATANNAANITMLASTTLANQGKIGVSKGRVPSPQFSKNNGKGVALLSQEEIEAAMSAGVSGKKKSKSKGKSSKSSKSKTRSSKGYASGNESNGGSGSGSGSGGGGSKSRNVKLKGKSSRKKTAEKDWD